LTDSFASIAANNNYSSEITQLLGEFVAACALLSSTLKFDGLISLQARGEGALSLVMAECTHHSDVRGIVRLNEAEPLPSTGANLHDFLGKGVLAITLDPTRGERYQGIVPLEADTLAGCLEHYFAQSEQLATRLWLSAGEHSAAGLLLQALPQQVASDDENRDHWETITTLAATVTDQELQSIEHSTLLYRLFHEHSVRLFSPAAIQFKCSCSRERSAEALRSLGQAEVDVLLAETQVIDIDCQFCNQHYRFDSQDIRALFGPTTLH
ncbi:MAG TPA: Hsp33 family molecular chaperone HslO, partial [Marinobacter sp.]|nr:Hsp33 family molecular chaperone HslO [Marinobacter sp.]